MAARAVAQVLDGATEPVRLDEHGDHRRATGLVGAGPVGDVQRPVASDPADGERRLISAMTCRPGRAERPHGVASGAGAARPSSRRAVPASSRGRPQRAPLGDLGSTDGRRDRQRRTEAVSAVMAGPPPWPWPSARACRRAEQVGRRARSRWSRRQLDALAEVVHAPGHEERGRRVESHDVVRAARAPAPRGWPRMMAAFAAPSPPAKLPVSASGRPCPRRVTVSALHAVGGDLEGSRRCRRGAARRAGRRDHERALRCPAHEHLRDTLGAAASSGTPTSWRGGRAGLASGPMRLKAVPHAQLAAHRAGVPHARVEGRRVEVGEAVFAQGRLGRLRRLLDPQAERRHGVRAARLRLTRPGCRPWRRARRRPRSRRARRPSRC